MGFFKKIFKGIGKVFKGIGKVLKKGWRKFGKFMGKLGIIGQIGMFFITGGIANALMAGLAPIFSAVGGIAQGIPGVGAIYRGAQKFVATAGKVFKTVTEGVGDFIKTGLNKIPGIQIDLSASGTWLENAKVNVKEIGETWRTTGLKPPPVAPPTTPPTTPPATPPTKPVPKLTDKEIAFRAKGAKFIEGKLVEALVEDPVMVGIGKPVPEPVYGTDVVGGPAVQVGPLLLAQEDPAYRAALADNAPAYALPTAGGPSSLQVAGPPTALRDSELLDLERTGGPFGYSSFIGEASDNQRLNRNIS